MDFKTDIQPILTSVIRHAITAVAGILGTAGALNADQQTQFIQVGTALVLFAIAQGWAIYQKRRQKARVADAAATGRVQ